MITGGTQTEGNVEGVVKDMLLEPPTINQLPDECLQVILGFVPTEERLLVAPLVCTRWLTLLKPPSQAWAHVVLDVPMLAQQAQRVTLPGFDRLLSRLLPLLPATTALRVLSLHGWPPQQLLCLLPRAAPRLADLSVEALCPLGSAWPLGGCSSLTSLDLYLDNRSASNVALVWPPPAEPVVEPPAVGVEFPDGGFNNVFDFFGGDDGGAGVNGGGTGSNGNGRSGGSADGGGDGNGGGGCGGLLGFLEPLRDLQRLDLTFFSHQDGGFGPLAQLTVLHSVLLGGVQCLPGELCALPSLKELCLPNYGGACFPSDVTRLGQLTSFSVSGWFEGRVQLPPGLVEMSNLHRLCISSADPGFSQRVGGVVPPAALEDAAAAAAAVPDDGGDVSGGGGGQVNGSVWLPQLEELALVGLGLRGWPAWVSCLRALRDIDLQYNRIASLPAHVTLLSGLTRVDVSRSLLPAAEALSLQLPADVTALTRLRQLVVGPEWRAEQDRFKTIVRLCSPTAATTGPAVAAVTECSGGSSGGSRSSGGDQQQGRQVQDPQQQQQQQEEGRQLVDSPFLSLVHQPPLPLVNGLGLLAGAAAAVAHDPGPQPQQQQQLGQAGGEQEGAGRGQRGGCGGCAGWAFRLEGADLRALTQRGVMDRVADVYDFLAPRLVLAGRMRERRGAVFGTLGPGVVFQ